MLGRGMQRLAEGEECDVVAVGAQEQRFAQALLAVADDADLLAARLVTVADAAVAA